MNKFKLHRFSIIILVVVLQLVIITYLVSKLFNRESILGVQVSVAPLSKKELIFSSNDLRNFYEPIPGSIRKEVQEWNGQVTENKINSDALNEPFDYQIPKPSDVFRIITLGDSFTYGVYVETKDNYPEQLEAVLNQDVSCKNSRFEIINLGMPGYDVQYSVERFKKRGIKYAPDLIIWLLKDDDFSILNELKLPLMHKIKEEMTAKNQLEDYYKQGLYHPANFQANVQISEMNGREAILQYQLNAFNELSNYYSGKLIIMILDSERSSHRNLIKAIVKDRPLTYYLEIPSIYKVDGAYLEDKHPSVEGYTMITKEVGNFLKSAQLIDCPL